MVRYYVPPKSLSWPVPRFTPAGIGTGARICRERDTQARAIYLEKRPVGLWGVCLKSRVPIACIAGAIPLTGLLTSLWEEKLKWRSGWIDDRKCVVTVAFHMVGKSEHYELTALISGSITHVPTIRESSGTFCWGGRVKYPRESGKRIYISGGHNSLGYAVTIDSRSESQARRKPRKRAADPQFSHRSRR